MIKRLIGISDCRGCLHRRLGGLYCGCRKWTVHKPGAWHKYGCWYYIDSSMVKTINDRFVVIHKDT